MRHRARGWNRRTHGLIDAPNPSPATAIRPNARMHRSISDMDRSIPHIDRSSPRHDCPPGVERPHRPAGGRLLAVATLSIAPREAPTEVVEAVFERKRGVRSDHGLPYAMTLVSLLRRPIAARLPSPMTNKNSVPVSGTAVCASPRTLSACPSWNPGRYQLAVPLLY